MLEHLAHDRGSGSSGGAVAREDLKGTVYGPEAVHTYARDPSQFAGWNRPSGYSSRSWTLTTPVLPDAGPACSQACETDWSRPPGAAPRRMRVNSLV